MRLVQVMIPAGRRQAVLDSLDEEGIDYALTDETSGREYTALVTFPLPAAAVEPVLDRLREAGIERDAYTVVVDAETVISRRFDELSEAYEKTNNGDRISRDELVARAKDLAPRTPTFVVLTVTSAVVATAGLLLDSPAIVVGSMVIAPLIGPAMATSVGTVLDDEELFRRGVSLQLAGGVLAMTCAALFALFLRLAGVVPLTPEEVFAIDEVRERLMPDVLSLAVALGAGIAGALSLSSGVSSALVGVMIAAALVPPTAVVGIGVAWGDPTRVLGSGVLVLVNFLSVNLAALVVLWYMGYRPKRWFRLNDVKETTVARVIVLGIGILLLSGFLVGVTIDTAKTASFETNAREAVTDVLRAHDMSLISMTVDYAGLPFQSPANVTIVAGHPPGMDPPSLVDPLTVAVADAVPEPVVRIGTPPTVAVEVRYVAVERERATSEVMNATGDDRTANVTETGQTATAEVSDQRITAGVRGL